MVDITEDEAVLHLKKILGMGPQKYLEDLLLLRSTLIHSFRMINQLDEVSWSLVKSLLALCL